MVDYDKPTVLQRNEPCPRLYGNQVATTKCLGTMATTVRTVLAAVA